MARRWPTVIVLVLAAAVVGFSALTFERSRSDDARDDVFAEYSALREDLRGLPFDQDRLLQLASQESSSSIQSCIADRGGEVDWPRWLTAETQPADGALASSLTSDDLYRPLAHERIEREGAGREHQALVDGLRTRAAETHMKDGDARLLFDCIEENDPGDLRPGLAIELERELDAAMRPVIEGLDAEARSVYASCMTDRGLAVDRPESFAELTSALLDDYEAAWADAPTAQASAGPAWEAVRNRELELSLIDADCRAAMIGDRWKELAAVLDDFKTEFGDQLYDDLWNAWREIRR